MSTLVLPAYSRTEEIWSASVHFAGVLLSILFSFFMIYSAAQSRDATLIFSVSVFGASMITLYTASTLYHAVKNPQKKRALKKFDHIAIYYLIAGTYTPFMLVSLSSTTGIVLFSTVWTLAVVGTFLKLFSSGDGKKFWSIGLYLGMGWMVVIASKQLYEQLPAAGLGFLVGGGLMYTIGTLFYVQKRKKYMHTVWHFFVLGGSIMHFFAIHLSCMN